MRILVTGAGGQVGWELARRGDADLIALDRRQLDITRPETIAQALDELRPGLLINAAAYTAVDRAETEAELAHAVNAQAVADLALACRQAGIPMFHLSTDYVFDGSSDRPYREDDPVCPLGVYGQSKAEGEARLRALLPRHMILRVSWVYGVHGHNFVKTMLRLGREREQLRVVADQWGGPTSAADIATVLLELATRLEARGELPWGTYHYCGQPATSWHALAQAVFRLTPHRDALCVREVLPIGTQDYPTPARRPANSRLDCSLIERELQIHPAAWEDSLAAMLRELPS